MIESGQAGEKCSEMWERLATQFSDSIPDHVIAGDPLTAIIVALCAEACIWKATGEADTHDIKDVLPILRNEVIAKAQP